MLEAVILGLAQGLAEWIPISSEGLIVAIKSNFFSGDKTIVDLIRLALFLHFGTFLSALVYFRKDVFNLTKTAFRPKESSEEDRKIFRFIFIVTLVSGLFGFLLLQFIGRFEEKLKLGSVFANTLIALMLFITATLQLSSKKTGLKEEKNLNIWDGLALGIMQGLSVIPGLSRSGLTVSALLLKKFNDTTALRLSFLLSLPIVFLGNLFLNFRSFSVSLELIVALIVSFLAGILTIDILLRLARKINFGYFAIFFGILLLIANFL